MRVGKLTLEFIGNSNNRRRRPTFEPSRGSLRSKADTASACWKEI
jgi:hypothetical protein